MKDLPTWDIWENNGAGLVAGDLTREEATFKLAQLKDLERKGLYAQNRETGETLS